MLVSWKIRRCHASEARVRSWLVEWWRQCRWKKEVGAFQLGGRHKEANSLKYLSKSDKPPQATNHILCSSLLCTRSIPSLVFKALDLRIVPSLLHHLPLLHRLIPPNKYAVIVPIEKNLLNNLNHTVTPSLLKRFLSKLPMTSTGPNLWFSFT